MFENPLKNSWILDSLLARENECFEAGDLSTWLAVVWVLDAVFNVQINLSKKVAFKPKYQVNMVFCEHIPPHHDHKIKEMPTFQSNKTTNRCHNNTAAKKQILCDARNIHHDRPQPQLKSLLQGCCAGLHNTGAAVFVSRWLSVSNGEPALITELSMSKCLDTLQQICFHWSQPANIRPPVWVCNNSVDPCCVVPLPLYLCVCHCTIPYMLKVYTHAY